MRVVKNQEFQFLIQELGFLVESKVISTEKAKEIQSLYMVKEKQAFTKTLLYVGSILIGAGILSFIASNWNEITKPVKFLLILLVYGACNFAGFKSEKNYPKTSRSLYYLGVIVFGAGIFLVQQMFHIGGSLQGGFLWWALGILPLAWVLRDQWILLAASIFTFIHLTDSRYLLGEVIPIWSLLWLAAIYLLNQKSRFSKITAFVNSITLLVFIGTIISHFIHLLEYREVAYIYGLIYFVIGMALSTLKGKIKDVYVSLGYLVHAAAALVLSFEDAWPSAISGAYIILSVLYLLYLLYSIKKGSLLSIIILCIMIFRFYIDISFDFLPKSFVFIIGGFLLLGFGFYFEKQRRKGEDLHV